MVLESHDHLFKDRLDFKMLSPPQCGAQKLLVVMPAPHLSLEEGCGILRRSISLQGHAIRKWDSRVGHVCNPDHHLLTETWWRPPCSFFPWKLMPKSPKALSLSDSTWHVPRRPRASKPVSSPARVACPVRADVLSVGEGALPCALRQMSGHRSY